MTHDRADWLAWRRQGLGGSDIAAVVGLSPWTSAWALWAEKVGLVEDDAESEAMEFGLYAEPMVANYFRDRTGLHVAGEQAWLTAPGEAWMRATADGFVFDTDPGDWASNDLSDALGVLEIKCTSSSAKEWETSGVPAHYQCQAQWLMAVSGFDCVYFAVLHLAFGRPQFRTYQLERDDADIEYLTAEGRSFWWEHVQTGVPPEVDGTDSTTRTLQRAWEADRGESVELEALRFSEYLAACAEVDDWQQKATELANGIKATMQSATEGTIDGVPVCTWRPTKAVDTVKLLGDLRWDDAVKTLNDAGFEVADHLKLDLADWQRANRKRAETYKTQPGPRRFVLAKEKK